MNDKAGVISEGVDQLRVPDDTFGAGQAHDDGDLPALASWGWRGATTLFLFGEGLPSGIKAQDRPSIDPLSA